VTPGASGRRGGRPDVTLAIDWPACRARGLCAELLPEHVTLDEWGYPVLHGPVPARLRDLVVEAVRACPYRALRVAQSASG
jgi:ferredoxin